ncbi:MAG: hypothetical protein IPI67_08730 [Myxococcales bacterium]|nr:hypothetical protein [Myxococcales bacterium]
MSAARWDWTSAVTLITLGAIAGCGLTSSDPGDGNGGAGSGAQAGTSSGGGAGGAATGGAGGAATGGGGFAASGGGGIGAFSGGGTAGFGGAAADGGVSVADAGWFDCFGCACDGTTSYCYSFSGGLKPPPGPDAATCDAAGPSGNKGCKLLPVTCQGAPACGCLPAALAWCNCYDDGGGLRVACNAP